MATKKEKLLAELKQINQDLRGDYEGIHSKMDDALLAYIGDEDITKLFNEYPKFCS